MCPRRLSKGSLGTTTTSHSTISAAAFTAPVTHHSMHVPSTRTHHRFSLKIQESGGEDLKPVYAEEGITYMFIKVECVQVVRVSWTISKLICLGFGFGFVFLALWHAQHNNVYLLAVTNRNANAALVTVFLNQLVTLLTDYFGELMEEAIRDNFVVVYELLDEVMDFGYPQITETKVLKGYEGPPHLPFPALPFSTPSC